MKLNLGCGYRPIEGYVNLDNRQLPGVDVVADCNERLPFEDNTFDEVKASDFLEHLHNDKRIHIMEEIYGILKPNGIIDTFTPSTDGRGGDCDPTHYAFWNEVSFRYYMAGPCRDLYGIKALFEAIDWRTTPMGGDHICHVIFKGKAIK